MEKLQRLTDRVWFYPYEEARDRPNLGYIRGDRWSLAVDAGHSEAHTAQFYQALEAAGLPLPALTVLTHWHWDHTLGMHAVHGLCLANARTGSRLASFREEIDRDGVEAFFSLDERILSEYAGGRPVIVALPDLTFSGEMRLDPGGCPVRVFQADAPHTDDSTFIHVQRERILFVGDATGGAFPSGEKDPRLCASLADTIAGLDVEICLHGHWTPETKAEMVADLRADAGNPAR